jgi:sulfatase maturation enzyme AslB (radical SAM superfamily)
MSDVKTVKWWDDADTMDQLIPILENVNSVHLAGGEPLLVPRLFELLEQVRQKNHFRITFNTSLFTKNKKLLDKIAVFKNTRVMVSLDGVEQHNDYVRYGSDWQTIVSNLELLEQNRMMLSITHVLQHTSIFALPALIKFVEQKRIELHLHEVYAGSYPAEGVLTINSAHPADVESFKQWLKTYTGAYKNQISNWIENYSYDSTLNNKFHQYVDMLDSIRGTNFKEVFKPTL